MIATTADPSIAAVELVERAYVHVRAVQLYKAAAWAFAREAFAAAAHGEPFACDMPPLETVGEFTFRPSAPHSATFRRCTSISGSRSPDVRRSTLRASRPCTSFRGLLRRRRLRASCRSEPLLGQRRWPERDALVTRLRTNSHGDRDSPSCVEGILARLVEAADGSATLPSTADPGFLCGMEFASLPDEKTFFARHGLTLDAVEQRIALGVSAELTAATASSRRGCARGQAARRSRRVRRLDDPRWAATALVMTLAEWANEHLAEVEQARLRYRQTAARDPIGRADLDLDRLRRLEPAS